MPRTISTKPAYSVRFWQSRGLLPPDRDAFELLRKQVVFRYRSEPPEDRATVLHSDMRELPRIPLASSARPRCVVTSPPYLDVTNFEEDQWLRLWFLGGDHRPTYGMISRDDRHEKPSLYWGFIADMWRMLGLVLGRGSDVVIRIGARNVLPDRLTEMLAASAKITRRKVSLVSHEISALGRRQTDTFRPGSRGCLVEVDCHFRMA